jgi:hypothetical protein
MSFSNVQKSIGIGYIYTEKWVNTSHYELKKNPKKGEIISIKKMGKYIQL